MATYLYERNETDNGVGDATHGDYLDVHNIDFPIFLAQIFTIGTVGTNETFTLEQVDLKLTKVGASAGNLLCTIRNVSAGQVTNVIDEASTIVANNITDNAWNSFTGFKGATLQAGLSYAIVLYNGSATKIACTKWNGSNTDVYLPGNAKLSQDGVTWTSINIDADADGLTFKVWGKTWTGTLSQYSDVIEKAGDGADANALANISNYVQKAESVLNARTKVDWTARYPSLNANTKYIIDEIISNLAAIKVINYNMYGYTSRLEAESMKETLRNEAETYINELKKSDILKFVYG